MSEQSEVENRIEALENFLRRIEADLEILEVGELRASTIASFKDVNKKIDNRIDKISSEMHDVKAEIAICRRDLVKLSDISSATHAFSDRREQKLEGKVNIAICALIFLTLLGMLVAFAIKAKITSVENRRPSNAEILDKWRDCESALFELEEKFKRYHKEDDKIRDEIIELILNTRSVLKPKSQQESE